MLNRLPPGVAHFTIISSLPTTSQDVATNFFLHPDSIGHNIAEEAVKWVLTLSSSSRTLSTYRELIPGTDI